ncbi:transcription-related protein [Gautieria morchelliformis]|nr:transcription-related protein [Gautieria morchelliformis]
MPGLDNANPIVIRPAQHAVRSGTGRKIDLWADGVLDEAPVSLEEETTEPIDGQEVFDLIRSISDPEHPLSLEELAVVSAPQIKVSHCNVSIEFTPTVPHCGLSTLIGLSIRVRLLRSLPNRFKVDIKVKPGSHQSEESVNKQLNDKERVAAALENSALLDVVEQCLSTAHRRGD